MTNFIVNKYEEIENSLRGNTHSRTSFQMQFIPVQSEKQKLNYTN